MAEARLKHFGWGREGEGHRRATRRSSRSPRARSASASTVRRARAARSMQLKLPAPRIVPPPALAAICSTAHYRPRRAHVRQVVSSTMCTGSPAITPNAPDVVAYPRNEAEIAALHRLGGRRAGGDHSVRRRLERGRRHRAAARRPYKARRVTIDLRDLGRVVEVDRASRAARIEGGAFGPALEAQLKPHGLTLRHFPQSFEYSTLGGWIATRSGGHFATLYTHIDDFVESLRVVTPAGRASRRGACRAPARGPSPDRMFIGSEGILGIITEAWMRLQDRPRFRAGGAVRFKDLFTAARALRVIAQAGLYPANCRILDPDEALQHRRRRRQRRDHGAGVRIRRPSGRAVDEARARMLRRSRRHAGGGRRRRTRTATARPGCWRNAFIRMPYARERTVARAIINDTFETAITWDRFEAVPRHA